MYCLNGRCHFSLAKGGVFLDLLEANMTKIGVRDISDKDPSDLEDSLPFVRCPHGAAPCVIDLNGKDHRKEAMGC